MIFLKLAVRLTSIYGMDVFFYLPFKTLKGQYNGCCFCLACLAHIRTYNLTQAQRFILLYFSASLELGPKFDPSLLWTCIWTLELLGTYKGVARLVRWYVCFRSICWNQRVFSIWANHIMHITSPNYASWGFESTGRCAPFVVGFSLVFYVRNLSVVHGLTNCTNI